ncbi:MAG: hypothetical protein JWP29_5524 [Rhodoferax sp.]|nr:hypothetical protein [Rhodoferax sp.]
MKKQTAISLQLDIVDWREAVGKSRLAETTLLDVINARLLKVAGGMKVEALMPGTGADRNWRVAVFDLGACDADEECVRMAALARTVAALSEIYEVAWASTDLQ